MASVLRIAASRSLARMLHSSAAAWKLVPINVPPMGDSIVDGTLRALTVGPGAKVAVDSIVATIETDKVTFEVRTPDAGVIKEVKAQENSTVVVGQPLFIIDTEGTPSASSAPAPSPSSAPAPAPTPASAQSASAASSSSASHHRVPSIQFRYGKREAPAHAPPAHKAPAKPASSSTAAAPAPSGYSGAGDYNAFLASRYGPSKATKTFLDLAPAFGRPVMSPAEMAAIESGGAY